MLLSSTVMTPSLPTLSIASAMISPTVVSAAEIDAVAAICSLVSTSLAWLPSTSDTDATAASMPRLSAIGFAPAATLRRPSRTSAWASTVAVVVPSPATSSVFLATSLTSSAPIFSYGSSSSISLAMRDAVVGDRGGAPLLLQHDVAALGAERHLHGVGELVHAALEAATGLFVERDQLGHSLWSSLFGGLRLSVPAAVPATDGPFGKGLTASRLALSLAECQFKFSTRPRRVQGRSARLFAWVRVAADAGHRPTCTRRSADPGPGRRLAAGRARASSSASSAPNGAGQVDDHAHRDGPAGGRLRPRSRWHGPAPHLRRAPPLRVHAGGARALPEDAHHRAGRLLRPAARHGRRARPRPRRRTLIGADERRRRAARLRCRRCRWATSSASSSPPRWSTTPSC